MMIEGLGNIISEIDNLHISQSILDRETVMILANKIDELEKRIDKLETELLINHFEQLRKDETNE